MSEIKDGGSAFPRIDVEHLPAGYGHGEHCEAQSKAGMTLRDYFAAKALPAVIAKGHESLVVGVCGEIYAQAAYAIADEMLKARE